MAHPENWIPNTGRPVGGRTVVLDLDGVISDATHRQHFVDAPRERDKDWRGFFRACVDDPVIAHGVALAASVSADHCLVILTARVDDIRPQTIEWLATNEIRHDWLILRGPHDGGPSVEWKRGQLESLRDDGADIEMCADDDPRNVEMMRSLGIPTLYIPSGYYTARDAGSTEYR